MSSDPLGVILEKIRADYGALTPANVLAAATAEDHPLHHRFEWDDTVAAREYRLIRAGHLIRKFKIRYVQYDSGTEVAVRGYVVVDRAPSTDDDEGDLGEPPMREYVPVMSALADDATRSVLLASARRDAELFKRRYQHLVEFADIVNAVILTNP